MSLSATIALIVLADVALIALVAFVMSRASFLKPHGPLVTESSADLRAPVIPSAAWRPAPRAIRRSVGVSVRS
jgi:hypothetical protein